MCDSRRPAEGADSEDVEGYDSGGATVDPPLTELPRANRSMVEQYVREAMPGASEKEVASQVSEVLMADALGRAIHAQRGPGSALDMNRCVRVNSSDMIEPVPYSYDDSDGGYVCDCEQIALQLVATMKAQQTMADTVAASQIVVPGLSAGRMN